MLKGTNKNDLMRHILYLKCRYTLNQHVKPQIKPNLGAPLLKIYPNGGAIKEIRPDKEMLNWKGYLCVYFRHKGQGKG